MALNLSSPRQVRELLQRLDFQPSRVLGQNFLIDGNTLRILVDLVDPQPADTLLEVGPGLGVLTAPLLQRAGALIAVEKDPRLFRYLQEQFADQPALTLLHADILRALPEHRLLERVNKIASNLPYSIAGRFLVDLSFAARPPARAVLTVQDEVADRLVALPGTKDYGALTVFLQNAFRIRAPHRVPASCFFPRPQVQSAIVVLEAQPPAPRPDAEERVFRALVRHAFSQRRKQMGVLLARAPEEIQVTREQAVRLMEALGTPPAARPEEMAPPAWRQLAAALCAARGAL